MNKTYKHIETLDFEGFECGPGWDTLILTALSTIEGYLDYKHKINPNAGHIKLDHVKEKFGGLRIYFTDRTMYSEYIDGVFDITERMSKHICEECGRPGITRNNLPWIKTLCENHYIDAMARKLDYTKLLESEK
jgi:hypothetical protein